ncbi:two-component system response regulator [Campylobacter blaseri]|uniref:DNA-binding response regulator n=1 Tax=Campylobacter blaseri TaxID=2042961 RepID=A0A2P8R3R4_9BACT|nr:response regulator transcription factor [Campylobacter blaseri]PSM53125.1 DNA-binding response regulator [Campylobacter blaseri]PSM54591.1 DNA-binding response regulator [Campylobacter blaseri]QKF86936.1 two-component system response regulator [Campylobacter blaseri]
MSENKKAQILILEDEEDLLELIEYNLQKANFETIGFLNHKYVESFLQEEGGDLMIVDRNLPNCEGSEFVVSLRKKGYEIPVIFLTAKDKDKDIEEGFLRGGDDYMTKPFNMNELILRIKAILTRTSPSVSEILKYKDLTLDLTKRKLFIDKDEVVLTKLEFDLLKTLIQNKNIVLKREYLLENVWEEDEILQDKTVNVAINRLTKKIDPNKTKNYIKSIWGVGYILC